MHMASASAVLDTNTEKRHIGSDIRLGEMMKDRMAGG